MDGIRQRTVTLITALRRAAVIRVLLPTTLFHDEIGWLRPQVSERFTAALNRQLDRMAMR